MKLDFEVPRRTALYFFESKDPSYHCEGKKSIDSLRLCYEFGLDVRRWVSPQKFCKQVEEVLTRVDINRFVIDLPFDQKEDTRKP
ncbi:hypothetical protein J4221_04295 [Candidatus Pacearchaeota archaeon]|nr:hypothetical protein [Candidatus Pacearchaeota archaeon]